MRATVVPIRELGPAELARWSEIQASTRPLDSPCLSPGFVRCAAAVRDGVEVAVLEDGGGVFGFFAFERGRLGVGHPVAKTFSDFQAVIAPAEAEWDLREVVRSCHLSAWQFDHLVATQPQSRPFRWREAPSPYVDLSHGFAAWAAERRRAGSREIEKILYEERKAERRAGPLRFRLEAGDDAAFEAVLRWKGAQLRKTGQPNLLALPWVRAFLDRVRRAREDGFSGVLSTLHVGDALAAVHLGVRSRTVLHYWLPAYDPAFASLSPGQICLVETAKAAAALGIERIDLGKGEEPYKARLMSGAIPVAEGAVSLHPLVETAWRERHRAFEWARHTPLRSVLRVPWRWFKQARSAVRHG